MKITLITRHRKVKWKKIKSDTWQVKKWSKNKNRVFYDIHDIIFPQVLDNSDNCKKREP